MLTREVKQKWSVMGREGAKLSRNGKGWGNNSPSPLPKPLDSSPSAEYSTLHFGIATPMGRGKEGHHWAVSSEMGFSPHTSV